MSRAPNTCYEQSENEIKKIIPLTKVSNRILRNKLNKRNTKLTFWKIQNMGERKDLNKWKDIARLWVGRFNILNMVILYKFIYGVDAILPKLQKQEDGPKIQMEIQSTWNKPKKNLEIRRRYSWRTRTFWFQNRLRATVITTIRYQYKHRHKDQRRPNRKFNNKSSCLQSINFQQRSQYLSKGKEQWNNWISTHKKSEIGPPTHTIYKN